ncbi:major facilitator superfamily MFS_1 protein [Stipitochalara longipes BDJ]|nr:major facilitator superfamily MFS_1 protein [Stipitochalara longipes BDJ]
MAITNDTTQPSEATPLISTGAPKPKRYGKSIVYRALICGFMVSLSFGVTQVPLIYVFRLMTCEAYYSNHPLPPPGGDRCSNHQIEADTAKAVSLLGASTTFFGVMNLFITGWTIKKLGVKSALIIQVFWPAVRLAVQNIGVQTGGGMGILIIQCSQIITIIGGPAGYLLTLNSYITEVVEHEARTGVLGQLSGCAMFGTSLGYLAGGLLSDIFGTIAPFRVTLILFLTSCCYVLFFLPWIPPNPDAQKNSKKTSNPVLKFLGPLKMFAPQKWLLGDGRIQKEWGTLLLGSGVFFGVLATSYVPVLLQMYSTDVLGFGTTENGYLISLNSLIRGIFLTLAFPRIIKAGRNWLDRRNGKKSGANTPRTPDSEATLTEPNQEISVEAMESEEEPRETPRSNDDERETFHFDLMFTKYSLIADGLITGIATFVAKGWQMYAVAMLLPFASGTGPAAKGTILQMCSAAERADALGAITLLEMIARLLTTTVFGLVFAAFANIGQTHLVFTCNAAVAMLGFIILLFCRFPPEGSKRHVEEHISEPAAS